VSGNDVLLIGVDGGATEVKAHAVACTDFDRLSGLALRPEAASRVYPRRPDFAPRPVAEQLAERDAGALRLSAAEQEQGTLWITAAAEAIAEVARAAGARRILVGVGMPGLKTPDGRGIHVINNGPRMPDYLPQLERGLAAAGLELAAPIAALGSDADYCGLGEEYAADGLFRDVSNAYYLGGGTGIADALKLRGALVPLDQTRTWLLKAWQIPSALGATFEKLASAAALNRVWAALGGHPDDAPPARRFPEMAARNGHPVAATWLDAAALVLAELIHERLTTLYAGRAAAPHRGEAYARLAADHPYRGLVLDRVIIGQRIGLLYADPQYHALFAARLDRHLAALLADGPDPALAAAYLGENEELRPGLVVASRLRAAPALGAAVAALRARRAGPTHAA